MEKKRSSSLSFRQALGIVAIIISLIWLCINVFIDGIHLFIETLHEYHGHQFHSAGFIIRELLVILLYGLIGMVITAIGIWLLRDRKGMYIQFLKN